MRANGIKRVDCEMHRYTRCGKKKATVSKVIQLYPATLERRNWHATLYRSKSLNLKQSSVMEVYIWQTLRIHHSLQYKVFALDHAAKKEN